MSCSEYSPRGLVSSHEGECHMCCLCNQVSAIKEKQTKMLDYIGAIAEKAKEEKVQHRPLTL